MRSIAALRDPTVHFASARLRAAVACAARSPAHPCCSTVAPRIDRARIAQGRFSPASRRDGRSLPSSLAQHLSRAVQIPSQARESSFDQPDNRPIARMLPRCAVRHATGPRSLIARDQRLPAIAGSTTHSALRGSPQYGRAGVLPIAYSCCAPATAWRSAGIAVAKSILSSQRCCKNWSSAGRAASAASVSGLDPGRYTPLSIRTRDSS